jgi:molybdate transport system substrate-binding protein
MADDAQNVCGQVMRGANKRQTDHGQGSASARVPAPGGSSFRVSPGAVLLTCILAFAGLGRTAPPSVDLTISAAISLQNALQEIAGLYHTGHPNVTVHLNVGASGTLQRQIEEGAPVDVFLSAAESEMDGLQSKGLIIPDTRRNLLTNSVVLIVAKGRGDIRRIQDLAQASVRTIAIGNPQSVPAGKYAQEVLTHFGLYDTLKPKFVFAKDVRTVLTYVATGNADAGIVYDTDALTTSQVTVVATAPPGSHAPVVYPVAVIAGSRNAEAAKAFESFLLGSESAEVFRKYGFHPVVQPSEEPQ